MASAIMESRVDSGAAKQLLSCEPTLDADGSPGNSPRRSLHGPGAILGAHAMVPPLERHGADANRAAEGQKDERGGRPPQRDDCIDQKLLPLALKTLKTRNHFHDCERE